LDFTLSCSEEQLTLGENLIVWDYLRNKSWKPECVSSFNMGWWILVFYPKPDRKKDIRDQ
jgi:hypothetical protein